jgi:hypothetical protein
MAKDEIPPEIKQVIIGAVDLCGRVSTWTEYVMDKSKSDKETCVKAYDVCMSASKLYASLHKAFTWKDISNMMDDLGISGQHIDLSKDKTIMPDGSVVRVGTRLAEVLKKDVQAEAKKQQGGENG